MLPPVLVREEAMYGTGLLPVRQGRLLFGRARTSSTSSGTSEVPLAAFHMGEKLDELPLRYVAFSTCFRREAGAAGKDTRGMFRVHQFDKVEMFVFCEPEYLARRARAAARHRGGARAGARPAVPRAEHRGGRSRRVGGEEVRHRGVVPGAVALPRDHVDVEHDRLPGAAARHPFPPRREASSPCTR